MMRVKAIDSHTGGEPTRVIVSGGPELGDGSLAGKRERFRREANAFRSAMVNEPRGSNVMVGAMLCEPSDPSCAAAVIFFNNVACLGMCGHGMIGLVTTLAHLGRIKPGQHRIETPVGIVTAELHENGEVSVENVPSHRERKDVVIEVPEVGEVRGDVAWGGNWFFLIHRPDWNIVPSNIEPLLERTRKTRRAVNEQGFPEVDHIEVFGAATTAGARSRNFVLCPGGAFDRSPCGTGTSAKLACLAADDRLREGEEWLQESIIGSLFRGRFRWLDRDKGIVLPTITGTAHVTGETTLLLDESDPFCWGIR